MILEIHLTIDLSFLIITIKHLLKFSTLKPAEYSVYSFFVSKSYMCLAARRSDRGNMQEAEITDTSATSKPSVITNKTGPHYPNP